MIFEILDILMQEEDRFYTTDELYALYYIYYKERPNKHNFLSALRKLWIKGKLERKDFWNGKRVVKYRLLPYIRENTYK